MTQPVELRHRAPAGPPLQPRVMARIIGILLAVLCAAAPVRAQEFPPPDVNAEEQPCEPPDTCGSGTPVASADEPADSTRVFGATAGAALLAAGAVQLAAGMVAAGLTGTMALLTLPSTLDANGLSCLTMICLVGPLHGALFLVSSGMATAAAAVAGWFVNARGFGRRSALIAPWLLMNLPVFALFTAAGVMQWLLNFVNCFCTFCGSALFWQFLIDNYDWPQVEAEYYSLRRCAPPVFFGCLCFTQLCVFSTVSSGTGIAALISGWWNAFTGRPLEPGERTLNLDVLAVPNEPTPVEREPETLDEEEWIEEELE